MSTLKVNKIRDTSGSADAIVLDPSGGVKMSGICTATTFDGAATSLTQIPAGNIVGVATAGFSRSGGFGKVIQYKYAQSNTAVETTSTSYQNLSASFSVAITPTSATNLLVARFTFQGTIYETSGSDASGLVALTDDDASSYLLQQSVRAYDYGGSGSFMQSAFALEHVKVAGNTNARTYSIRYRVVTGDKILINNYIGSDGDTNSVLSVMEVEP